jgi:hypothetical protein
MMCDTVQQAVWEGGFMETINQMEWFKKSGDVIERYCMECGKDFKDSEGMLAYGAGVMPEEFSNGSEFRRNVLHEVKSNAS